MRPVDKSFPIAAPAKAGAFTFFSNRLPSCQRNVPVRSTTYERHDVYGQAKIVVALAAARLCHDVPRRRTSLSIESVLFGKGAYPRRDSNWNAAPH